MTLYIPDDIVAEIKHTADIVDIVSESVRLKKTGRNYVGLCPFHSEKTPSFTVSADKQIFHCFGCGEGGDVFRFVMKHQGLDFTEAVVTLARRYGVRLPSKGNRSPKDKTMSERQQLRSVNSLAMDFFKSHLREGPGSEKAARYLAGRGISSDVIEEFHLGYAPAGWDNLAGFLAKKGVPLGFAEKAGLVVKKNSGTGYYDRFRDRIIFPIMDISNRVIGFGGRVLDDSLPKYLNSPETPLYHKGRSLYGLSVTKNICRQSGEVFITEGYMDFLALYGSGIKNVVATLGTALTVGHVRALKGFVEKAILVFDSDEAGMKAARRSIDVFNSEKGLSLFILVLPKGHDPDSYVREKGTSAFKELAATAQEPVFFLLESAIRNYGLSVDGKIKTVSEVAEYLAAVEDSVARSLYVKEVAERLGIEERAMLEKVRLAAARQSQQARRRPGGVFEVGGEGNGPDDDVDEVARAHSIEYRMELQIIAMMLHVPEMICEIEEKNVLDFFTNDFLKSIGNIIVTHRAGLENRSADIVELVDNDAGKRIITALFVGDELSNWTEEGCRNLINRFMTSRARRSDNLTQMIKAAEENHDDRLLDELLKAKGAIARQNRMMSAKSSSEL